MIPFRVDFRPGNSLYEQVVYAATKAIISGQMRPGDAFPSVRALSRELKINPNTAHKVVTNLIATGLIESRPGIGTLVSQLPEASKTDRTRLLEREIEELVVEARKLGIEESEVVDSLSTHWKLLGGSRVGNTIESERGGRAKR